MTRKEIDAKMISLIDKPFLDRLTEVARCYGWAGDYSEVGDFVIFLYNQIDVDSPPEIFSPYEED